MYFIMKNQLLDNLFDLEETLANLKSIQLLLDRQFDALHDSNYKEYELETMTASINYLLGEFSKNNNQSEQLLQKMVKVIANELDR